MANRKRGEARNDRLRMLYPMNESFTCSELAKEWCLTYEQAIGHIRHMCEANMLTKTGPRNARIYRKTVYALG